MTSKLLARFIDWTTIGFSTKQYDKNNLISPFPFVDLQVLKKSVLFDLVMVVCIERSHR